MIHRRRMFLSWENATRYFEFPLLPERLDIEYPSYSARVNIDGLGEVAVHKDPSPTKISFSSCFPAKTVPGIPRIDSVKPRDKCKLFEDWMRDNTVLQFMLSEWGLNMTCTVEAFKFYERGGDVDSIYYTLTLASYRKASVRQVKLNAAGQLVVDGGERLDTKAKPKTYTAPDFEDLYTIAKEQLGKESLWKDIYVLNADLLCGNFYADPGMVLILPDKK